MKKPLLMRERIAFDKRSASADGFGNTKGEWVEQFAVRARRLPLTGGEDVMAGRLAGKQSFVLQIRSSSVTRAIDTAWRARDTRGHGAVYNIRTITNRDERSEYLDLLVEQGVADG